MKIPYTRRKQTSKEYPDGKWHRVMGEPPFPGSECSPRLRDEWLESMRLYRLWRCHPQTFCRQAYIEKYWLTQPDHDHFREVCEDCEAEVAARVLIGKLVID